MWVLVFAKAASLFLVLDPIGNIGPIASLIHPFSKKDQARILRRETLFSLIAMFAFLFGGATFLNHLGISQAAVEITGGLLFLFFALNLLFSKHGSGQTLEDQQEPWLVPIAIPLIAGPSCLAAIILFSHTKAPLWVDMAAIFLAWIPAAGLITLAPRLAQYLGQTGVQACEQLVGLLCILIATQSLFKGFSTFWRGLL